MTKFGEAGCIRKTRKPGWKDRRGRKDSSKWRFVTTHHASFSDGNKRTYLAQLVMKLSATLPQDTKVNLDKR